MFVCWSVRYCKHDHLHFQENFIQVRSGPVKRTEKGRDEKTQELLSQQSELRMQVHCIGCQGGGRHRGSVLAFSYPCLVSVLFTSQTAFGYALSC